MIHGHGGNVYELAVRLGCAPNDILDMSSNLNPWGPPQGLEGHLADCLMAARRLPEVDAGGVRAALAEQTGVGVNHILCGNGTTQFIYLLPSVLGLRNALILGPTYSDYADACRLNGCRSTVAASNPTDGFIPDLATIKKTAGQHDAVFICNPNNPTGACLAADELIDLCRTNPKTLFIVDESYLPFCPDSTTISLIGAALSNAVVLHSFSKIYRIPGLRIGFLIAPPAIADKLAPHQQPWSVNSLACEAAAFILSRPAETARFVEQSIDAIEKERRWIASRLEPDNRFTLFPGRGPFTLARLSAPYAPDALCQELAKQKILIRDCTNFQGLANGFIRFSFKSRRDNQRLINAIEQWDGSGTP